MKKFAIPNGKPMTWRFYPKCALITAAVFLIEILIALFVHDRFIRPFIGDVLVVVLIYFAVSSVIKAPPIQLAGAVWLFACVIEWAQYMQLAAWLGLQKGSILYVALGATADWMDVVAYGVGGLLIMLFHKKLTN